MFRTLTLVVFAALLAACSLPADENAPAVEMGQFRLGHNIVVVSDPEIGPFSREATDEELKAALEQAINTRFSGYQGDRFLHIGTKLDLYALALPGVPLVFTPNSVFVVTVNIWDDATGEKLTPEEGKDLTIFEGVSSETVISSGLTQTKEAQMKRLAANTAKAIQDYILENPEWVGLPPAPAADDQTN